MSPKVSCFIDGQLVRRTMLFVPANIPKFYEKAYTRGADAILLDLEDSVPMSEKEKTRNSIKGILPIVGKEVFEVFVRINSPLEMARKDVESIVWPGLSGFVYPKASVAALKELDELTSRLESQRGLPRGSVEIIPLIESARGVMEAYQIATSSPRIKAMAGGNSIDLSLEIGADGGPDTPWGISSMLDFRTVSEIMILAATAAGVQPMGTAGTGAVDYSNPEVVYMSAVNGRKMGFKGSMCIHPAQVDPLNRGFTPSKEEVEFAEKAAKAFEEGIARGTASVPLEGRMIDVPVYERAKKLLARAEAIRKYEESKRTIMATLTKTSQS